MKKNIGYFLALIVGLSVGLVVGLSIDHGRQDKALYTPTTNEIKKASSNTMGEEVVNKEIIDLLTDMYSNSEYVHVQKQIENTAYPFKNVDDEVFERLTALIEEYEWRANRTLNDYTASDFDLLIEIYTPDMMQVLTLYGGYDLVLYKDTVNDMTAYYTYIFPEEGVYADLAGRIMDIVGQ